MKFTARILPLLLLVALVVVPLQSAGAKGLANGEVIFGQTYLLKSGQTLDGDLVILGGSASIENGATVNGTIALFGGVLSMDGEVTGDVAVVGGTAKLGAHAHIHGDLSTVGTSLDRTDGSQVDGQVFNAETAWGNTSSNGKLPIPFVSVPPLRVLPNLQINFDPLGAVVKTFFQAFGIALLAMVLMLFLAPYADRVAHAIIAQPLTAGGLGLLTVIAVPVALVALGFLSILVITLIVTVPVMLLLAIGVGMAILFGWIAIGYEIGQRLAKAFHQEWHPSLAAGLGTFIMTLLVNGLNNMNIFVGMQCVTSLLPALVIVFALGAVVMTRFGTQLVTAPVKSTELIPPAGQNLPR